MLSSSKSMGEKLKILVFIWLSSEERDQARCVQKASRIQDKPTSDPPY